ncbi:MAG: AAA family ATPase [Verrucomicrobiales bacterium]
MLSTRESSRLDWNQIMGMKHKRTDGYERCLGAGISKNELAQWLGAQEAITFQEGEEPSIYRAVKRAILSCLPDSQKLWFSAKYGEPVVQWRDGSIVAFSNLSDGQKGILALVGDIARRAALLNPQFGEEAAAKTPGVVLIDELDLHLHPRWQRRIVDDLKRVFPLVQFIATSHSPFIIQSLEPGELVCLDDDCQPIDYSRSSLEDIAEEVMGVEVPQRSKRFQEMLGAAEEYFRMVRAGETDSPELEKAREEFEALSEPFSNDPAMAAFLKLQREADSAKHQRREPAAATS